MATEILKQVQENCPRDLKTIENVLAMKSEKATFIDMIVNKVSYSYYATTLRSGKLDRADIAVGFVAKTPTTFTISIYEGEFTQTKSLNAGEFHFAFYDNVYPLISSMFKEVSISNVNGSGYIIYANLDSEPRKIVSASNFSLGDYHFVSGIVITNEQSHSSAGKKLIEMSNLPNSPTMIIDYMRQNPSSMANPNIVATLEKCKVDNDFFEMIGVGKYLAV